MAYMPAGEKSGGSMIKTEVVKVDHELAMKWLEHNIDNRKIDQRRVVKYANMMRSKLWKLNGESIIFSKSGKLLNGQHRLWAVIESGQAVEFLVVRGVEDNCFDSLDNPKVRDGSTVLSLAGRKNCKVLSAALAWKWKYDSGQINGILGPSPSEVCKMAEENEDFQDSATQVMSDRKLSRICAPSVTAFCMAMFRRQSETRAEIFFDGLSTGANLEECSPVYLLRERLIQQCVQYQQAPNSSHTCAVHQSAWVMYCEGKKCRQLRWSVQSGEQFPRF